MNQTSLLVPKLSPPGSKGCPNQKIELTATSAQLRNELKVRPTSGYLKLLHYRLT